MPLPLLVRALPGTPELVLRAAESLTFRNTVFVYLKVKGDDLFPDQWLYVHSAHFKTGRITNFRNWVSTLHGEEQDSILCMELWCSDGDPLWSATDKTFIGEAKDELRRTGLVGEGRVEDGHVLRVHRCYPVYKKGYRRHLDVIRDHLRTVEGLAVIGRYGSFKYNNQDHCILMGILAAENIAHGADHDLWSVNTDYDTYQESAIITESGLATFAARPPRGGEAH